MVLFPGTVAPLHIFEPRYREMLADCLRGDQRFGLICLPPDTPELALARGRVGTVARIESADSLPDGRSNIMIAGEARFAFERYIEAPQPYHVAATGQYDDFPEPRTDLAEAADRLRKQFERVARAARTLADDGSPSPPLPDDPAAIAYAVAAMMDLTTDQRQGLLEQRSPSERIRDVGALLEVAASPLEQRAGIHERAKTNGRGTIGVA
jgi:Lon protease-like protein